MRRVLLALAAVLSVAAFAGPPGRATLASGPSRVICSLGQCASFCVGRDSPAVTMGRRAGAKEPDRTALREQARAVAAGNAPVPARLGRR